MKPTIRAAIRSATTDDLDAINKVIEAAVMGWNLPERVKRLSLSSYRYTELDMKHLEMVVAEVDIQDASHHIIGIAAWEKADPRDSPQGQSALLLHGLYVLPDHHHKGIGLQLFQSAELAALKQGCSGLLVKAQEDARGFFEKQGMQNLPADDPMRDYTNRFWKAITTPSEPAD